MRQITCPFKEQSKCKELGTLVPPQTIIEMASNKEISNGSLGQENSLMVLVQGTERPGRQRTQWMQAWLSQEVPSGPWGSISLPVRL